MVLMVAIYSVPDYERWKQALDGRIADGLERGVTGYHVCRAVDDPNEVMVVVEVDTREHAQEILAAGADTVREFLDRAGLDEYPALFVGEPVEAVDFRTSRGQRTT